jgi:hypothetical protein
MSLYAGPVEMGLAERWDMRLTPLPPYIWWGAYIFFNDLAGIYMSLICPYMPGPVETGFAGRWDMRLPPSPPYMVGSIYIFQRLSGDIYVPHIFYVSRHISSPPGGDGASGERVAGAPLG